MNRHILFSGFLLLSFASAAQRPVVQTNYTPDPAPMVHDGTFYIYTGHDEDGVNSEFVMNEWRVYSSKDMVNWTDHGSPLSLETFKWAESGAWASQCVERNGKFYWYVCCIDKATHDMAIGVAVSDSPVGPWQDERGSLLITRGVKNCADVTWLFDPAVFVDDDGTGYLAFGGGIPQGKQAAPGTARIVRLGEDMISLAGDPVRLDVPWLFEDSGINKIGDKYVYSYCSNFQTQGNSLKLTDGAIQYMISDNPLGPYTYMGELFPNEGRFFGMYGNNHHSIASLNGEWYLFYHNRPVEKAMGIFGNYRSPQADKIFFGEDGLPKQVKGTMKGLDQVKPLNPFRIVSAATMSRQAGVTVEGANGQSWITGIPGSWLQVSGVDFGTGASTLLVTAMAPTDCTLYAVLDQPEGPVVSQLRIELPGDVKPAVFRAPIQAEGVHDLYLITDGEMKLYSWQLK